MTGTVRISGVPWSTGAGLEGPQGAAERPALTPTGPLPAKRRCLTVVAGPNALFAPDSVTMGAESEVVERRSWAR